MSFPEVGWEECRRKSLGQAEAERISNSLELSGTKLLTFVAGFSLLMAVTLLTTKWDPEGGIVSV